MLNKRDREMHLKKLQVSYSTNGSGRRENGTREGAHIAIRGLRVNRRRKADSEMKSVIVKRDKGDNTFYIRNNISKKLQTTRLGGCLSVSLLCDTVSFSKAREES